MTAHSHEHSHRPTGLADIVDTLTELTLAGDLAWQRIDVKTWRAARAGVHFVLDDEGLLALDDQRQTVGHVGARWLLNESKLKYAVKQATTLGQARASELLTGVANAQAVSDQEDFAERERQAARARAARRRRRNQRLRSGRDLA